MSPKEFAAWSSATRKFRLAEADRSIAFARLCRVDDPDAVCRLSDDALEAAQRMADAEIAQQEALGAVDTPAVEQ